MDLTDASGLNRVSLQPTGYQFGFVDGDDWDNNWLIIAGAVGTAGEKWSFREPCLLVEEATEIAEWLERIATGRELLVDAEVNGGRDPLLEFIEPNLAFSARFHGEGVAVVRVHFAPWSFPADGMSARLSARLASRGEAGVGPIGDDFQAANSEAVEKEAFNSEAADSDSATSGAVERVAIDIVMSFGAILGATEQWRKELAQFPAR